MWVPPQFEAAAPEWAAELVDRHPFGLLVTQGERAPVATHVPMLIHPEDRDTAATGLAGCRVLGHLARANGQWRSVPDGTAALLVFAGPHGYVSPATYADEPAAPTWNYVAVHLTGTIRWIRPAAGALGVLDATISTLEARRERPWQPAPSRRYHERIVVGVVAFEFHVTAAAGAFKLSQDQPEPRRAAVRAATAARPGAGPGELAEWMRRAHDAI